MESLLKSTVSLTEKLSRKADSIPHITSKCLQLTLNLPPTYTDEHLCQKPLTVHASTNQKERLHVIPAALG